MEGLDEQIVQRIYINFLIEPQKQIITNIFNLLEQVPEKSKEFLNWKDERLRNPPEDFQTLLSEDDYNFVKGEWGNFTCVTDRILKSVQYIDCLAPFEETLKYLPFISKKGDKIKNLFLQAEGKRLIIKYIAKLKKIDPPKRATGISQSLGQSGSRIKTWYTGMPVSAKSANKDDMTNTSRPPQDVNTDSVSRSDSNSREDKSQNEKTPSEITHSAQGDILDSSKEGVTLTYIPHAGILEKETKPNEQNTPASFTVRDQEERLPFETIRSDFSQTGAKKEESTKETNNINILLLGETRVGKSTFINSLLNNIYYSTFKATKEGKLKILIDTAFTISDERQEILRVSAKANCGNNLGGRNESFAVNGESSTQRPVVHRIYWEDEEGHSQNINIIDTPGFNDTRGIEQDKRHFKEIFKEIDSLGELQAICFLLKPNEARFTSAFRYCFDELLTRLHRSATDNILFCFTNTRSTFYRAGDTLFTLREYLAQLERENNILIRADRDTIFCFDNDCFRYALAVENNVYDRTSRMDALFTEEWDHNVKETKRFLNRAQSLPTQNIQDTVSLNVNIRLLVQLARPLAKIARIHLVNMKLTDDHIADAQLKAEEVKKEIKKLEDSKRAMELEDDLIRDFCAEASVFLHHNSMNPMDDPYKIVLDEIVAEEKNKAAISGNNDMLYEVQTLQVMYTDRICSEIAKYRRGPLMSDEIQKRIINLSLQKICGNEVKNLMTICKEITNDTSHNNFINT